MHRLAVIDRLAERTRRGVLYALRKCYAEPGSASPLPRHLEYVFKDILPALSP